MKKLKTVTINNKLHRKLKIRCVKLGYSVSAFVELLIFEELTDPTIKDNTVKYENMENWLNTLSDDFPDA